MPLHFNEVPKTVLEVPVSKTSVGVQDMFDTWDERSERYICVCFLAHLWFDLKMYMTYKISIKNGYMFDAVFNFNGLIIVKLLIFRN